MMPSTCLIDQSRREGQAKWATRGGDPAFDDVSNVDVGFVYGRAS